MKVKPLTIQGLLILAAPIGLLTACGESKPPPAKGQVEGEILPGSASDAMLPLDTVRSQAPLAPRQASGNGNGEDSSPTEPNRARRSVPQRADRAGDSPAAVAPADPPAAMPDAE